MPNNRVFSCVIYYSLVHLVGSMFVLVSFAFAFAARDGGARASQHSQLVPGSNHRVAGQPVERLHVVHGRVEPLRDDDERLAGHHHVRLGPELRRDPERLSRVDDRVGVQVVQALNHAHRGLVHLADQTQRVAIRHDVLGVEDDHGGGRVGEGSGRAFVDATRRRGRRMPIDGTGRARERRLDVRLLHRRRKRHDVRFPESAEVWTETLTAKPKPAAIPPHPHTRVEDTARVACRPPRVPWCADPRDGLKGSAGPVKSRPSRFAGGDCA